MGAISERCRCNEPRTPEHRCWATQEAELEALREVERAAKALRDAVAALVEAAPEGSVVPMALAVAAFEVNVALAKLDEVRR